MMKKEQPEETSKNLIYDKDIREPLFDFLEETYGKIRIFEEKMMGKSRADVVMVIDNAICGLEIKSDADSYARLKRQVRYYDKYFDYNYVVIGKSHLKHIEEHVPKYWGIIACYEDEEDIHFEEVREASKNPKRDMNLKMSFLWRRELETIKRECVKFKYYDLSKAALRAKLVEKVDEETLDRLVSRELFDRDYTTLEL